MSTNLHLLERCFKLRKVPLLLALCATATATDLTQLCAGRAAVERVYYNHRLGQKQPFEQASPPALIEKLVREDLRKEAALRAVYGVQILPAQLDGEVQRIQTTSRAPEMLAEIHSALGNDPAKFAVVFAKPFLVERLLRERFENDAAIHAPPRRLVEGVRGRVLAVNPAGFAARLGVLSVSHDGEVQEPVTWQLAPPPADDAAAPPAGAATPPASLASSGHYSIAATAQVAQALASPAMHRNDRQRQLYFADLPARLQDLLRAQLQQPGDVSAVVETPAAFQIYLLKDRSPSRLSVVVFTRRKLSFDEWLDQQPAS